jgi:hypothetical protein
MEVLPFSQFPAPVGAPEGYGVFVRAGANRMQVGSIMPLGPSEVMLNVQIMKEMQLRGYETCSLSQVYASVEDATEAARSFLAANAKP